MNLQVYFYLITISSTFYSIKKCIDKQSKGTLKNPTNLSEKIQ